MTHINHNEEKNSLYKCHFCQQNIEVYGIEKHFATFHKFQSSIESEYVCEFLVVNHLLHYKHWKDIYIQFMMESKITNVNFVANHSLAHQI